MSDSDATTLARAVVSALIASGVREIVHAPGSRNAPLAFAAFDAAEAGLLRLHTRIDERSAGFLALGLTKAGSRAAVVCTSGTAVANLHPAVLEAAHAGVDLVVVTADRPASLRGTGANQTTDQVGIFGSATDTLDIATSAEVPAMLPAGAVHWNVQFSEPLTPADRWAIPAAGSGDAFPRSAPVGASDAAPARQSPPADRGNASPEPAAVLPAGPRSVVVAGDDAGMWARRIAQAGGWPLLAEPTSGSRAGANALRTYRLLLDGDLARDITDVVVVGHPTLSRPVARLLARPDVRVWSVPPRGVWAERPWPVAGHIAETAKVSSAPDPDWLPAWQAADRDLGRRIDQELAGRGFTPHHVAAAVSAALAPGDQLVVGASNPIRDLDLMARPYEVGTRRKTIANRGLAGIDGVVSTAIGAAIARGGQTYALMGDVTFLHDSNGLILGPDEQRPDLVIVVVNDDGGSIFATLEQGAEEYADRFERLFATPHGVDIESLCAATRTPHLRVSSSAELEQALRAPNGGIEVIEARVSRADRREIERALRDLV